MRLLQDSYRIVNSWWEDVQGDLTVFFVVQSKGKKTIMRMVSDESPYFFTTNPKLGGTHLKCQNGEFYKVETKLPSDVPLVRENVAENERYEADIIYTKRFMIDKGIEAGDEPLESCVIDIECLALGKRFPTAELDPILSISLVSSKEEKFWWSPDFPSEREMLQNFFSYILDKYSLLLGWNFVEFDWSYLCTRAKHLGMFTPYWHFFQVGDLQYMFTEVMRMYSEPQASYALEHVAKKYLKKEKLPTPNWENRQDVYLYNMNDSRLEREVDQMFALSALYDNMSIISGSFFEDTTAFSRVIDVLMLKTSFSRDWSKRYVHRTSSWMDEVKDPYTGGFVATPIAGLHDNVVYLDLKSLYPSIILAFNLSFDTIATDGDIVLPGNGLKFRRSPLGIYPQIIKYVQDLRDTYKAERKKCQPDTQEYLKYDRLQNACKFLACSFYGVFGSTFFRAYDVRLSEGITLTGRKIIHKCNEVLQNLGYTVVYNDTDSTMYKAHAVTTDEIITEAEHLVEVLNRTLKEFMAQHGAIGDIEIKIERVFSKLGFLKAKKKYFGKVVWEDGKRCNYVRIVGMEARRGDWCQLSREVQEHLMNAFLDSQNLTEIRKYVSGIKVGLYSGKFDDKCVIVKGFEKDPSTHKNPTAFAQLAVQNGIGAGDKIWYVVTGKSKEGKQSVGMVGSKPCYDYYWKKYVLPIVSRIYDGLGIRNQTSLSKFFGGKYVPTT